ncbi:hypothetical protein E2C01_038148 [Portunus trituberculatus]|uniref:Uncharacterized protein n=1 Tax=Portunus trituberculatus TaxID=210409 RepID=A0A5B7FG19_PORTR|nr:hypothetical protein [Portunus trituberculatus]
MGKTLRVNATTKLMAGTTSIPVKHIPSCYLHHISISQIYPIHHVHSNTLLHSQYVLIYNILIESYPFTHPTNLSEDVALNLFYNVWL